MSDDTCSEAQMRLYFTGWKMGSAKLIAGDKDYSHKRHTNAQGTVLEIFEHDYVTDPASYLFGNKGHCVPGSKANTGSSWDDLKCEPPNAFVWGEEVIKFFVAHPKK